MVFALPQSRALFCSSETVFEHQEGEHQTALTKVAPTHARSFFC